MTNRIEALTQRPIEKAGHETNVDPMGGNARGTEPDRATAGHCRVRHDHATGRGRPHHSPVPGRSCDASAVSASGCPGASWLSQTRRSDGGSESPSIINGCFSSDRNTNSSRISNSLLFAAGSPQIAPIDIWAQFFACDLALRGPLDGWAALCRDWPVAADPLIHHRWSYTQQIGQRSLATQGLGCLFDWVHAATLAGLMTVVNSRANS